VINNPTGKRLRCDLGFTIDVLQEGMKKRIFLIVLIAVAVAVAGYELTTPIRMKGVVRRLLRSPDVKVEVATKLAGGREPVYGAIIVCDEAKGPELCASVGLRKLVDEKNWQFVEGMEQTFPGKFLDATNQDVQIYVGILKHAPFATHAVVGKHRTYFVFERY
jgi:hypothetical protein